MRDGLVVTHEAVYAADEPRCCPSQLRKRAHGWDGGRFVLVSDQLMDNPAC